MKLSEVDQRRLDQLYQKVAKLNETFIGYPANAKFSYPEIKRFLKFTLNNAGDPFSDARYLLGTREFEREVVGWFAKLFGIDDENYWGYVTNGGTEGNMEGLWLGKEKMPGAKLYFSADSHYSVAKIGRILNMGSVVIESDSYGAMNIEDFKNKLQANSTHPAVVVINHGTTMKGAIDDKNKIIEVLNMTMPEKYYVHVDGALTSIMNSLVDGPHKIRFQAGIGSISVSGHKFIGSPVPCGVFITNKHTVDCVNNSIEYVGINDTTISGSRNAVTPLLLWIAIHKYGIAGLKKQAMTCFKNARYLKKLLDQANYEAKLNPESNIVWMKRPSEQLCQKWELAVYGDIAHVVVMQQATRSKLKTFVADILSQKDEAI